MAYFENPANFTDIVGAMGYANTHTGGLFGAFITVIIFMIVFIQIKNTETTGNALMASSFVSGILSLFLMGAGLIDQFVVIIYAGLLGLSVFLSKFRTD